MNRFYLSLLLFAGALSPAAVGQTVIVNDDFEGYSDEVALHATWAGNGAGDITEIEDSFILTSDGGGIDADFNGSGIVDAADYVDWRTDIGTQPEYDAWRAQFGGPPGGGPPNKYVFRDRAEGATVAVAGNLQYVPPLDPNYFDGSIFPSQGLEPIVLRGDIFTPDSAIQRNTIGLRSNSPANIFEMGVYNDFTGTPIEGAAVVPSEPDCSTVATPACAGFGIRAQLFVGTNPNWQFFAFDPSWDTNGNGLVTEFEVFAALGITETGGWHTLQATFEPVVDGESGGVNVTVTIDLLRDGMNNAQNSPGVDATLTFPLTVGQVGFDSLRIGGPSQLSSSGEMGFDNIYLSGPQVPPVGSGSIVSIPEPATSGVVALFGIAGWLPAGRCRRCR